MSAAKVGGLFVIPAFALSLGPSRFGILDTYLAVSSVLVIAMNQERVQSSVSRIIGNDERNFEEGGYFWIFYLILAYLSFTILSVRFDEHFSATVIVLTAVIYSISLFFQEYLRWSGSSDVYFYFALLDAVALLGIPLLSIYLSIYDIETYVFMLVCSRLLPVILLGAIYKHRLSPLKRLVELSSLSYSVGATYLSNVVPATCYTILQGSLGLMDRLLLLTSEKLNEDLIGNVSLSYRLAWGLSGVFLIAWQVVVQPKIASDLLQSKTVAPAWIRQLLPPVVAVIVIICTIIVSRSPVLLTFVSRNFPEYSDTLNYFSWHLGGIILINALLFFPELITKRKFSLILVSGMCSVLIGLAYYFFDFPIRYLVYIVGATYFSLICFFTSGLKVRLLIMMPVMFSLPVLDNVLLRF